MKFVVQWNKNQIKNALNTTFLTYLSKNYANMMKLVSLDLLAIGTLTNYGFQAKTNNMKISIEVREKVRKYGGLTFERIKKQMKVNEEKNSCTLKSKKIIVKFFNLSDEKEFLLP